MAIKLNEKGFEYAKKLIDQGKIDLESDWSSNQPNAEDENKFITNYGLDSYEKWFLATNTEKNKDTKAFYEFPFGNFEKIFRQGVIAIKHRAGQYHHTEIEQAASKLLDLIDSKR